MNHLKNLCLQVARDGEARKVTRDELVEVFTHTESHALLKTFGLHNHQVTSFFELLDFDHCNSVDIDEFVAGLMRLRGAARGVDLATVVYENKRIYKRMCPFMAMMENNF